MAMVPFSIRNDGYLGQGFDDPNHIPSWKRNKIIKEAKDDNLSMNSKHLRVDFLDVDRLVKVNNLKEVTNPVFFQGGNIPTVDGLLSNEIFGITRYDRQNTCAYIDLVEPFLNPEVYKIWSKLDKKIIAIVHGTQTFSLDSKGVLVEDPNGETGLRFFRKIFDKINIARTASIRRDANVDLIERCQEHPETTFINKMIVIPAYYRDVDTSKKGKLQVGEINELYRNLLIAVKSLRETTDYGLDLGESVRGRIQQILVQIFDWFGTGTTVGGEQTGANLPGKVGVIRRSVMSKTTDYSFRGVLSAPELKYEKISDMPVDIDHIALPLAGALSAFLPFVIFSIKRFFENAFTGNKEIPLIDNKTGEVIGTMPVKDYQIQFSEDRIKKEINKFLTGYSNRLIPVEVEGIDGKKYRLRFKGYHATAEQVKSGIDLANSVYQRDLVWVDVFYIAAVEATQDKYVLVTRYPINKAVGYTRNGI